MPKTTPEQNKAIVLKAFDALFNKRDYAAAEHFWSPKYIQHSAHIAPGREGLFALVRSALECPAIFVPVEMRQTGTRGAVGWHEERSIRPSRL